MSKAEENRASVRMKLESVVEEYRQANQEAGFNEVDFASDIGDIVYEATDHKVILRDEDGN